MKPLRLSVAAAMLALAGCGLLPKKQPLALYAPEARVASAPDWPTVAWSLQIPRPHADELLDSPRIVVRPAPGELQVYKGAVWAQPVPDLVRSIVLRDLEDSGRIAEVSRSGAGLAGDYTLLLDVRRFQSSYQDAPAPMVEVDIKAKLVSTDANRVVANRLFRHNVVAHGADVPAVVRAFDAALARISHEIVGWTLVEGQRDAAAGEPPK